MNKSTLLTFGILLALFTGCKTNELYHWGHYEDHIYLTYAKAGKTGPQVQIDSILQDMEKARAKDKPIGPGIRAHLGYLYAETGQLEKAKAAFMSEKEHFPESSRLMDNFIGRIQ